MRPHDGSDAADRRGRPRRRQDTAAVAHRGQDAGRPLVHRRQLPRTLPVDGVVDGAREGPAVRRAGASPSCRRSRRSSSRSSATCRPPPYPYAIDRPLAARGQGAVLLAGDGLRPLPRRLRRPGQRPLARRAQGRRHGSARGAMSCRDGFIDAFNGSPLAAEGALVKSRGYAATPLTGVWANFPYLHNGSVPTLHHLLGPVSERPKIFHVMAARRLDRERVGQLLYVDPAHGSAERGGAAAPVRRRSRLVQHGRDRVGQRRARRLAADPDGCEPARADRISEDAVADTLAPR